MSVVDRQKAAGRAVSATAGVSAFGAGVQAARDNDRVPVQDNPIPGGENAPLDTKKFEQAAQAAQDRYTPVIPDAKSGLAILRHMRLMSDQLDGLDDEQRARYEKGMRAIRLFESENPGALRAAREEETRSDWLAANLDTTPAPDSRRRAFERERAREREFSFAPGLSELIEGPTEYEDAAPGTRGDILLRKEQEGLDTASGFGDFGTVFRAGLEFNSPSARAAFMEAAVREELAALGIEVPPELPVVKVDEDLQELVFLRPTEDGKVKWTLAESEHFRPEDIAAVSDLPSTLSMIGAVMANLAPQMRGGKAVTSAFWARHPFAAEYLGDLGGRQLGTMLEYWLSTGEVTPEEFQNAIASNHMASAIETAVGRTVGRVIQGGRNVGTTRVSEDPAKRARAERTLNESADTLTDITRLTDGKPINISRAEATGDFTALQEQAGREKTLTKKARDRLEQFREENLETYRHVNHRIAQDQVERSHAQSVEFDGADPLEAGENAVNAVRRDAGNVAGPVLKDRAPDGSMERYRYYIEGDTSRLDKDGTGTRPGWEVVIDHREGTVQLHMAYSGERFKNQGPRVINKMLEDLGKYQDYRWYSDNSVSPSAQFMIDSMNRQGWDIRVANPEETWIRRADTGERVPYADDPTVRGTLEISVDNPGVYEIVAIPGKQLRNPLPDAEWEEYAMREMVEDVAGIVPQLEVKVTQDNKALQRLIGWSDQRQVGNIKVENPSSSPIRQIVRRIQNRAQEALDGVSQREADQRLADVTVSRQDEEGIWWLEGLGGDSLDYGQLTATERKLADVFEATKDPEVGLLLQHVRGRLSGKGKWTNLNGDEVTGAAKGNITRAYERLSTTSAMHQEAIALTNGSNLFARNLNGELVNINMQAMRRYLGNETQFIKQIAPVLKTQPEMLSSLKGALREIYEQDIIKSGWTRAKHNNFMKKYDTSMKAALTDAEYEAFKQYRLGRDTTLWAQTTKRSEEQLRKIKSKLGWDQTVNLNADSLSVALRGMRENARKDVLRDLEEFAPEMLEKMRLDDLARVEHNLNKTFFDGSQGVGDAGKRARDFGNWFDENESVLRTLHGDQYVTDLRALKNTLKIEGQRARVAGNIPDNQPLWLRITRTVFGPLSRPQRQMTAGTYTQQRVAAAKVLQLFSDPEKLRHIRMHGKMPGNSQAAIAALTRVGFFDAFGIHPEDEDYLQKAHAIWQELDAASRLGLEDSE